MPASSLTHSWSNLGRLCWVVMGLSLSSCLQIEQTITLNPDNSGKALIQISMINPMGGLIQGTPDQATGEIAGPLAQAMAAEMVKGFADGIVRDSQGIDTWHQVHYGTTKEGRFNFEGVAYFPDFNAFSITTTAGKSGSLPALFRSERLANGKWVVRALSDEPKTENTPIPAGEIDAKIKEVRENWAAIEAIAAPMMKDAKAVVRLQVAGNIQECAGWKLSSAHTATFETDVNHILTGLGALIQDDTAVRKAMTEGRVNGEGLPQPDFGQLRKLLFDDEDKAELVIDPGEPLFDYSAEVAAAARPPR